MATTAQYVAQPILESFASGTTANTSRSAPGASNILTLCSGPTASPGSGVGKRILRVTVVECNAVGAGTANVIRFWLSTDGGTTKYLLCEKAVPSVTSSTTAIGYRTDVPELVGLVLPGAASNPPTLYFTFHNTAAAGGYHITIESGLL